MRSTVVSKIITFALLTTVLMGQEPTRKSKLMMADPLFGMSYNASEIHFERAPARINQLCRELRDRELWVYAVDKTAEAEYFIVSGFLVVRPDTRAEKSAGLEPDGGDAVEIQGESCYLGTLDWLLSGKMNPSPTAPKASRQVLEALVSDAVTRYVAAFGGKQNLIRALSSNHVVPGDLPPVLRNKLQELRKSE